jgi:glycosyltransferase involved in cell wall biosynthesis
MKEDPVPKEGLRVTLVEAFWGGSHRSAAEGWAAASRHAVAVEHLPPRFWKWRMRGAAFEFARRIGEQAEGTDVLFVTDLADLAHLLAFLYRRVPSVLYFHENQVDYPARRGETVADRDLQYAFTNLASALAADRVVFNSNYQKKAFFAGFRSLLRRMPDARPLWTLDAVERKSEVVPLGVPLSDIPDRKPADGGPPIVLWNHRWEYDKDPESFFRVLLRLESRGVPYRLIVVGESFGKTPYVFTPARNPLRSRVVHWGYVPDRKAYVDLLCRADVVLSTAIQENFGVSLLEAAFAGAHPLAPRRLSYPEVLPEVMHGDCLYEDEQDLEARLEGLLGGDRQRWSPAKLRHILTDYRWEQRAAKFDALVEQVFEEQKLCYKWTRW